MQGSTKSAVAAAVAAIAIGLGLGAGCIISSDDGSSTLTIDNESSYVITEVHIAAVGVDTWGPNLIPDALLPGESLVITNIDCDTYDVLVTDETGVDCVLGNLDLCFDDGRWVVTNSTLDTCAFNP